MIGSIAPLLAATAITLSPVTPADRIHGTWAGTVINVYSGHVMSGFSWFEIDRHGRYVGRTIAKKPGDTCYSYDPNGWTGKLYRYWPGTYLAINDGADEGYIIQADPNRQSASSVYVGREQGVMEANWFARVKKADFQILVNSFAGYMCK